MQEGSNERGGTTPSNVARCVSVSYLTHFVQCHVDSTEGEVMAAISERDLLLRAASAKSNAGELVRDKTDPRAANDAKMRARGLGVGFVSALACLAVSLAMLALPEGAAAREKQPVKAAHRA